MNTSLLTCLRGSGERLRPALSAEKRRRPIRFWLMQPFRVFNALTVMPLFWPSTAVFYLPSFPRTNSKSGAVFDELVNAGIPRSSFWYPPEGAEGRWRRIVRLLTRLPWALAFLLQLKRRVRRLDNVDLSVVLGRESFRRSLRKTHRVMPVIISDVSPTLHMLWSAATAEGSMVFYWQDDYHHVLRPSYPVTVAAVLNQSGYEAVRQWSAGALVFRRPSVSPKPMRPVPKKPRVGVATNAFFVASSEQRELLNRIREALEVAVLEFRLHPNAKLNPRDFPEPWIKLGSSEETIEQFAARLDLVVVGNSAVQLKLACEGVPVLHTSGLDPHGFDLYGYCANGFSFGTEDLGSITVEQVSRHFQSKELAAKLRDYVSVREGADAMALTVLAQSSGSFVTGFAPASGNRSDA